MAIVYDTFDAVAVNTLRNCSYSSQMRAKTAFGVFNGTAGWSILPDFHRAQLFDAWLGEHVLATNLVYFNAKYGRVRQLYDSYFT